jgi:hypothetical protein
MRAAAKQLPHFYHRFGKQSIQIASSLISNSLIVGNDGVRVNTVAGLRAPFREGQVTSWFGLPGIDAVIERAPKIVAMWIDGETR